MTFASYPNGNSSEQRSEKQTIAERLAAERYVSGFCHQTGRPFIARVWSRRLRPEEGTGDWGQNLLDDIAEMRRRPEFDYLVQRRIPCHPDGSKSPCLLDGHCRKLYRIIRRYRSARVAAMFLRHDKRPKASMSESAGSGQDQQRMGSSTRMGEPG
jgi:hypothetical protein